MIIHNLREEARDREQQLTNDLVLFRFNVGPTKLSLPLPWKKSLKHLYANYVGAYNFLQKNLAHVSDLGTVASYLRRQVDEMNPASLHQIEEIRADKPIKFGQIMNLLKSPALPNAQQLLVKATAQPPVIAHDQMDLVMRTKEGEVRQADGYRFLEWPFQILNSLNLQRYDQKVKMRDSDLDSQSSDTDENGEDSEDDDEQGADANIQLMTTSPCGKNPSYNLYITKSISDQSNDTSEDVIIADVVHAEKDTSQNMTKEPVGDMVIDLTPTEPIITSCDQSCKMLSEALMVQQKMTKLLIQELKSDQSNLVEKVKNEISQEPMVDLLMLRLQTQGEDFQKELKNINGKHLLIVKYNNQINFRKNWYSTGQNYNCPSTSQGNLSETPTQSPIQNPMCPTKERNLESASKTKT